jgi:hypothetical protein
MGLIASKNGCETNDFQVLVAPVSTVLPDGSILVNHFSGGRLYRIQTRAQARGAVVPVRTQEVLLSRLLSQPDGMKVLSDGRILVVEQDTQGGNGRLTELRITGASAEIAEWVSKLDSPTAIAESRGRVFFVEGRYRALFVDKSLMPAPFRVSSVAIPQMKKKSKRRQQ